MSFYAFQSTEKSRERLHSPPSRTIDGLDLNVNPKRIQRYSTIVSMPWAIPEMDLASHYERVIRHLSQSHLKGLDQYKNIELMGCKNFKSRQIKEITLRVWVNDGSEIYSRILLLFYRKVSQGQQVYMYHRQFGNVDLALIPPPKNVQVLNFVVGKISSIPSSLYCKIARYLDHGQVLNLGELFHRTHQKITDSEVGRFSEDPFQQYLSDFEHYNKILPNGVLMKPIPSDVKYLLHQTAYKTAIVHSKQMKVSKAGCLGNSVYTTVLHLHEGQLIMSGHGMALSKRRKVVDCSKKLVEVQNDPNDCIKQLNQLRKKINDTPDKEDYLLLELGRSNNQLTNWIDKTGRGRLFLETRNRLLDSYAPKILSHLSTLEANKSFLVERASTNHYACSKIRLFNRISKYVLAQYRILYPLFVYVNQYRLCIKQKISGNSQSTIVEFDRVYSIIAGICSRHTESKIHFSFLNSLLFEMVKDFILLSQDDKYARIWRKIGSFNMHYQYLAFFRLAPSLVHNWETSVFQFGVNLKEWKMNQGKFLEESEGMFEQFFLDRLSSYFNVHLLEGKHLLPIPDELKSFDQLAFQLPGLSGMLFHHTMEQLYGKETIFEEYRTQAMECYAASYKQRNLTMLIKAGYSATEEIGLTANAEVDFYDLNITPHEDEDQFVVVEKGASLDIKIKGVSQMNGFTTRTIIQEEKE